MDAQEKEKKRGERRKCPNKVMLSLDIIIVVFFSCFFEWMRSVERQNGLYFLLNKGLQSKFPQLHLFILNPNTRGTQCDEKKMKEIRTRQVKQHVQ